MNNFTIKKLIILIFCFGILSAQVNPSKSLHRNPPRTWALTNATIHTEPGKTIFNGTVLIKNGIISSVGKNVKIPLQTTVIKMEGKHIYAGFIESWMDVKSKKDTASLEMHWNSNMRSHLKASEYYSPNEKELNELRELGFTSAHLSLNGGIFQGRSSLVNINKKPKVLSNDIAQAVEFKSGGWGAKEYPTSLLGAIAFIRQGLIDARWYGKAQEVISKYPDGNEQIEFDQSLDALGSSLNKGKPFIFETKNELYIDRAYDIANEFELKLWIKGNGYEYRRLNKLNQGYMIIPINYPAKPEVANPYSALQYSTQQLKHWDMAPDNLKKLSEKDIEYSLTSSGLKNKKDFRKNLSKSIKRGFSEVDALASLTTVPAKAFGQSKRLGKIAPGYIANLVITNGNYFNEDSKVQSVWIEGNELQLSPEPINHYAGLWTLKEKERTWALDIDKNELTFSGKLIKDSVSISLQNLFIERDQISFTINDTAHFNYGAVRFIGRVEKKGMSGKIIYADNNRSSWTAELDSKKSIPIFEIKKEEASKLKVFFPEGAYGIDEKIVKPKTILVDDATIWTSGSDGVLKGFDILFQNGKVKKIAKNIYLNDKNAIIIDGKGKHITPGLIDAHSHMAGESINEGFQNVTAEVRMRDVIDPNDIAMYRALAGGLTTINLLHGSANPIGGQSVVMKLRWGSFSNELIFNEASQAIKFALGENVKRKRSYGRYPETRMGVEQVIRDAFSAARDYSKSWNTYNRDVKLQRTKLPPRRDLELDALVEILDGKRIVHAHSYRQDEILMLTRIAEDFGFTMGTFQHVLEGYKIAERLVEHGASASTFSDWWAYKFEVIDAIPYNGTLMANVGVNVSFNSDSDELARRMNLEAAKAVKYGGLSEEEALKMVTINPAKQLKIDKYVGSLEIGKDADFVLWSGHPLSNYTICEQTWVDGKQYFSQKKDTYYKERDKKLRNDLIQKILVSGESGSRVIIPDSEDANEYHTCNSDHYHDDKGGH